MFIAQYQITTELQRSDILIFEFDKNISPLQGSI